MSTILKAHVADGRIQLDEPFDLPDGPRLLVRVIEPGEPEREAWATLAKYCLARAYGDDEPEYTLEDCL